MRILQIIAQKPGQTGSGIYLNNLSRACADRGHQLGIIAGIDARETDFSLCLPPGTQFWPVHFQTPELPFPVVGMSDEMPYPSTRYREMTPLMTEQWKKAFAAAFRQAADFQPDLVIVHHLWLLAAMARNFFADVPMIAVCHGTELRQMSLANQFRQEVIAGCRRIDGIAALHQRQREDIAREYGIPLARITVSGSAYDQDIFYPPQERSHSGQVTLLYAGKLSRSKGVPSLLRSFASLPEGLRPMRLVLVGAGCGPDDEEVRRLAAESPHQVVLAGAISQRELAEMMRQSQIFILASFFEGLSLVTLEALACGMRVVANDLPGMRDWVGQELVTKGVVHFVDMPRLNGPDQPLPEDLPEYQHRLGRGIARQITALANCPDLTCSGWEEVSARYSWPALLGRIEKIYRRIIADKKE